MPKTRVNELDLLRFLAALAVVLYHYAFRGFTADGLSALHYPFLAPAAQYGFLGVQLFFLISGFVILLTANSGSCSDFFISRVVRLYPVFWACCTLTFVAILLIGAPRFSATWGQYLANLTLLGGFVGVRSIDGVYWSLFIEIQFYAMVFVVIALRRLHQVEAILFAWLAATAALQFFPNGKLNFLLIGEYSGLFIGGAAAYLIWSKGCSTGRLALFAGAWLLALGQTAADIPALEAHFATPFSAVAMLGAVTAFFAIFLAIALHATGRLAERRWVTLGALTYPLYLLHQNIGYMLFNRAPAGINEHQLFWGVVVLVLAAAYAVHAGIEKPLARRLRGLLLAAFAAVRAAWPGRRSGVEAGARPLQPDERG